MAGETTGGGAPAGGSKAPYFLALAGDPAEGRISAADRARLADAIEMRTLREGETIFAEGDPCRGLYAVESGTVVIRKRERDERSLIVRIVYEGSPLGYRTYFSGGPYSAAAEAVDRATVSFLPSAEVERLLDASPALGRAFLRQLADDLREAEDARFDAVAMPVRARLARLLFDLRARFGTVDDEGVLTISLPLGRRDIAALLGTRAETIARAVRSLETEGVASFAGRKVVITDLDLILDEIEAHQ